MDALPASRTVDGHLVPPCPKCHRIDKAEEEKRPDDRTQWFTCTRCGTHYVAPPRHG